MAQIYFKENGLPKLQGSECGQSSLMKQKDNKTEPTITSGTGNTRRPIGSELVVVIPAMDAVPIAREERPMAKRIFFFMEIIVGAGDGILSKLK